MSLPPNKEVLAEIRRAALEAKADPSAEVAAVEAYMNDEFHQDNVDGWFVLQRGKRPELFAPPVVTDQQHDEAHADLAAEAFEGAGNLTARGKLIQAIGAEAADKTAKRFGLKNVSDFKSRGVKPNGTVKPHDDGGDKSKASNNPFLAVNWNLTEQSRLVRLNPTMAASLAQSAGVKIGATRPVR